MLAHHHILIIYFYTDIVGMTIGILTKHLHNEASDE